MKLFQHSKGLKYPTLAQVNGLLSHKPLEREERDVFERRSIDVLESISRQKLAKEIESAPATSLENLYANILNSGNDVALSWLIVEKNQPFSINNLSDEALERLVERSTKALLDSYGEGLKLAMGQENEHRPNMVQGQIQVAAAFKDEQQRRKEISSEIE